MFDVMPEVVTVRLTHFSHVPDYSGKPGDVVEVPGYLAKEWIDQRGAVLVDQTPLVAHPPEPPVRRTTRRSRTHRGGLEVSDD